MMKWIFGVLVLANIGLWMWAQWYREPPGDTQFRARSDFAPEKMKLLTEPGALPKAPAPTPAPPPEPTACFRIGPFLDSRQAELADEKLSSLKLKRERDAGERKAVTGYRVYLPPLSSRAEAERKRRELTRLGFKDHALISDPGLENAISLGVFGVEANAKTHVARLVAKGIKPSVSPMEQTRMEIWFDVREAPADTDRVVAQALDELLRASQATIAGVECTDVRKAAN